MKQPNLFGELQEVDSGPPKGKIQKRKASLNYRKAYSKTISCKNCEHLIKKEYHNKTYYKCELIGDSQSTATDVRLNHVCREFKSERP